MIGTIGAFVPNVAEDPRRAVLRDRPQHGPRRRELEGAVRRRKHRQHLRAAIGMSTGPSRGTDARRRGASSPSTHVTVPVADRSMSPESSMRRDAEPGSGGGLRGRAGSGEPARRGGARGREHPAARLRQLVVEPAAGPSPGNETGSGRRAIRPRAPDGRLHRRQCGERPARTPDSRRRELPRVPRRPRSRAAAPSTPAAPPIGTGGVAGAWRMSSMLWIGVIPQIGVLRERPAVGERADQLFVDVDRAAAHPRDDPGASRSRRCRRARGSRSCFGA